MGARGFAAFLRLPAGPARSDNAGPSRAASQLPYAKAPPKVLRFPIGSLFSTAIAPMFLNLP
jgi:hypothetical protein